MNPSSEDPTRFSRIQDALAGTWSIERELGRGGMGTVYLAREVALDRPVALKVLHAELAADPVQHARFVHEARTGARLSHPHIVPIYAVEEDGDLVFFVMGLVDGESLGERLRRAGPLKADEAERILREVAWALSYAHAMGVVHCDVTIENILLERQTGRAVLADFGIAAAIDREGDAPLLGTPAYLAPEVIQGAAASPVSDLYGLGVVGWTILAGRTPFIADDTPALLLMHLTAPLPPLHRAAPGTPSRLVRAVEAALVKDPSKRPESADHWLDILYGDGEGAALAEPLQKWLTRWDLARPFYALGMTVTAMLTIGLATWVYTPLDILATLSAGFLPVLAILATIHLGIELAMLRRVSRLGFRHGDLRLALARARQHARRIGPQQPALLGRLANDFAWLGMIAYLGAQLFVGTRILDDLFLWPQRGAIMQLLSVIAQYGFIVFWSGIGLNFLVPSFHFKPDGWFVRARDALWDSWLGAGVMKLAAIGLGTTKGTEATLHRPTELVLDLAIEDLWKALPPSVREGTSDLPRVTRSLRERVAEARDLRAALQGPRVRRSAEADALDARLSVRQDRSILALERLRMVLGRVGSAAALSGELTAKLNDARGLERELLLELGAHADVKRLLKQGRAPTSSGPRSSAA